MLNANSGYRNVSNYGKSVSIDSVGSLLRVLIVAPFRGLNINEFMRRLLEGYSASVSRSLRLKSHAWVFAVSFRLANLTGLVASVSQRDSEWGSCPAQSLVAGL